MPATQIGPLRFGNGTVSVQRSKLSDASSDGSQLTSMPTATEQMAQAQPQAQVQPQAAQQAVLQPQVAEQIIPSQVASQPAQVAPQIQAPTTNIQAVGLLDAITPKTHADWLKVCVGLLLGLAVIEFTSRR